MRKSFFAGVIALVLLGSRTFATVGLPADFREIVAAASLIVRGHVTDVRAVIVPNAGIESVATVAVDAVLKGDPTDFVTLRVPGGVVGRERWVMVDAPVFATGDRAVLFLKRDPRNQWRPVGLNEGVYRILPEAATGRAVIAPPIAAGLTASAGNVVRGDPARRLMATSEFESLVQVILADVRGSSQRGRQ
jgi:hypothetical protein